MKLEYPKEWFERSAEIESTAEVGAGCAASAGSRILRIELTVEDEAAAIRHMKTLIEMMSPPLRSGSCGNRGGWSTSDRTGSSMATWESPENAKPHPGRDEADHGTTA